MDEIIVECGWCGMAIQKPRKEYNRSQKLGRSLFCNLSCSAKFNNKAHPKGGVKNFKGKTGTRRDELSPFRWHLRRILSRKAEFGTEVGVDLNYLKNQWDNQRGRCPYTGLEMSLVEGTLSKKNDDPCRASLDRIKCELGYVPGNVEFVCVAINLAKHCFSQDQMKKFVDNIRNSSTL